MNGPHRNAQVRGHSGADTAISSDNTHDVTPIIGRVKAALLNGQSIRLIDYPPGERQQVIGAIAVLRDELPINARWSTVRESHLSQTRLRALRYWIPGEFLGEDSDYAN